MRRAAYALAALAAACNGSDPVNPAADAAPAGDASAPITDATPAPDRIDPLLWVEMSATGCDTGGHDDQPCTGAAPLAVRFLAAAPADVDTYLWTFGDGTPIGQEASPLHVYESPGVYDVALTVGGPGGTASTLRAGFVVAMPAPLSATCARDSQCAEGLRCVCGDSTTCPAGLGSGVCTADCDADSPCGDGAVCANLDPAGVAAAATWQRPLCLSACESDGDCRDGFACRELLDAIDGAWVRGCFAPGVLADLGRSCADAGGVLDDAACTSGACADLGARGQCTADCGAAPAACPSYAACASDDRCVARCDTFACDADPWLACEPIDVDETPIDEGYCAAKSCTVDGDCPGGTCAGDVCGP